MDDSSGLPSDPEELQTVIEEAESRLTMLQERIAEENIKMERYRVSGRGGAGAGERDFEKTKTISIRCPSNPAIDHAPIIMGGAAHLITRMRIIIINMALT